MRIYLVLVLILIHTLSIKGQSSPSTQWIKSIHGQAAGNDNINCSFKTNTDEIYVAGNNESGTFITCFTASGSISFTKQLVDSDNNTYIPKIIRVNSTGEIFLSGVRIVSWGLGSDFFVLKLDATGNLLWEKFESMGVGYNISDIKTDNDNDPNYFVFSGFGFDSLLVGKYNIVDMHLDFLKKHKHASYYGGISTDLALGFGNIYICGYYGSAAGFLMKFNGFGVLQYENVFTGSGFGYTIPSSVTLNTSGDAFIYGTFNDPSLRFFVRKYNSAGSLAWSTPYLPAGETISGAIQIVFNNSYSQLYAIGQTNNGTSDNGALVILNPSSGIINYSTVINYGSNNEQFDEIKIDNSNNYYLIGKNNSGLQYLVNKRSSSNTDLFHSYYTASSSYFTDPYIDGFVDESGNIELIASSYPNTINKKDVVFAKYNSAGGFLWDYAFDGSINVEDNASKIVVQSDQSSIVIGTITNSITGKDVIVKKLDQHGNAQWTNQFDYGVSDNQVISAQCNNALETYILSSTTSGFTSDLTVLDQYGNTLSNTNISLSGIGAFELSNSGSECILGLQSSANNSNLLIYTYSGSGAFIWNSGFEFLSGTTSKVIQILPDNSGNIYVLGKLETATSSQIKLEKYNALCTQLWETLLTGYDASYINNNPISLLMDNTGNLVVAGQVIPLGYTGYGPYTYIAGVNSSTGTQAYSYNWAPAGGFYQYIYSTDIDNSNNIYLSGSYETFTPGSTMNAYVQKINTSGSIEWTYTYPKLPGVTNDMFNKINFTDADEVITTGTFTRYTSTNNKPYIEVITLKLSTTGTVLWEEHFSPDYKTTGTIADLAVKNDRIFILGTGGMSSGDAKDIFIFKMCDHKSAELVDAITGNPVLPNQNICSGNSLNLGVSSTAYSYSWFPGGESTPTILANTSGSYYANVIEEDGCLKTTDTISIVVKAIPTTPDICMVTVDTLSTHNIIYWDKSGYTDLSHFVIYREDITNIYFPIASVPFDSLSEYHDFGANPNITTKRYKITAVDTCGNESLKSGFHNTIYISHNGLGEFSWNLYEIEGTANPVTNFVLLRDDLGTNVWNIVGITAGTQQILVDPDFALYELAKWRVETVWGISCTPTRAGVSTSRSNVRTKSPVATGLNESTNELDFQIYPNPANEQLTIKVNAESLPLSITIKDASGRIVKKYMTNSPLLEVNTLDFAPGVYQVEVGNNISHKFKNVIIL